MDYYIFRINKKYKGLIDDNLIMTMLEKERNAFYNKQIKEIILEIPWLTIIKLAKDYFQGRNDIHISDYALRWESLFNPTCDELLPGYNCLLLHQEEETSPFRPFLFEFDENWIFIPKEKMKNLQI